MVVEKWKIQARCRRRTKAVRAAHGRGIFGADRPLDITFADKSTASAPVVALDLERVAKVAVVWHAPVNLDLHVYEDPGPPGAAGQVSATAASSAQEAAERAEREHRPRGFMSTSDDGRTDLETTRVEVYTLFPSDRPAAPSMALALDYETRGSRPQGATCAGGALAVVDYEIIRRSRTGHILREPGQFSSLPCGVAVPETQRFNPAILQPLRSAK